MFRGVLVPRRRVTLKRGRPGSRGNRLPIRVPGLTAARSPRPLAPSLGPREAPRETDDSEPCRGGTDQSVREGLERRVPVLGVDGKLRVEVRREGQARSGPLEDAGHTRPPRPARLNLQPPEGQGPPRSLSHGRKARRKGGK